MSSITRFFNFLVALAGLLVLLPVFLVIALGVLIDGGRPVFYRESRLGYRGKPFEIIKFRTLTGEVDPRPLVAPEGDPRVTRIGRFLRRTHLDELPQLFNILAGDMSIVGPRPARPEMWQAVAEEIRGRALGFRPGLTSPASLDFICEDRVLAECSSPESAYRERLFPAKAAADLRYFEGRSVLSDLAVICRTIYALLGRRNETACRDRVRRALMESGRPVATHTTSTGEKKAAKPGERSA